MNILILKPSSLGDVVHTLPAVELVRQAEPSARISWLVNEEYAPLVALCPAVDQVIPFQRRRWGRLRHCGEFHSFTQELRAQKFDVVLDFQGLLRSGFLAWSTRAPRRVGFRTAREGAALFYTERVTIPPHIHHAVDRYVELVRHTFQLDPHRFPTQFPALVSPQPVKDSVDALLRAEKLTGHTPLIAVAPCARWDSKMWPAPSYAVLLDYLAERLPHAAAVLVGTAGERAHGDRLLAHRHHTGWPVANLMGQTQLLELLELFHRCDILVANDSGPVHLATAARLPTVAFYGPTNPLLTGPYGHRVKVLQGDCPNAPCFKEECPLGDLRCWASIAPTLALGATEELLNHPPRQDFAVVG